jgi:hypothetical protein
MNSFSDLGFLPRRTRRARRKATNKTNMFLLKLKFWLLFFFVSFVNFVVEKLVMQSCTNNKNLPDQQPAHITTWR